MVSFRKSSAARSSGLTRLGVAAVVAIVGLQSVAFTGGIVSAATGSRLAMRAEASPAPAPAPAPSSALVKVSEENVVTTAGVLGGLLGLWFGGLWLGAGLFAASSFAVRQDNDVSKAIKGLAANSLEALNFTASMNEKYAVTDQVGSKLSEAIESEESVKSALKSAKGAIDSVDKDVGIKDTVGSLLTSASNLAATAVDKAIEVNDKYKVTDQLTEKVKEATKKAS